MLGSFTRQLTLGLRQLPCHLDSSLVCTSLRLLRLTSLVLDASGSAPAGGAAGAAVKLLAKLTALQVPGVQNTKLQDRHALWRSISGTAASHAP
jgi:hypothetical protein